MDNSAEVISPAFTYGVLGFVLTLIILIPFLGIALIRSRRNIKALRDEIKRQNELLAPVNAISELAERERARLDAAKTDADAEDSRLRALRAEYSQKRSIFDRLTHEVRALEDKLDLAELGMYEPKFQYENTAQYTEALTKNRNRQKQMIADETAVHCLTTWTVDGSRRAGQTMSRRAIRMTLRAFNNECEVLIAKVSWRNHDRIEEQIRKSFDTINKLNESNKVIIADEFLILKLQELELAHEEKLLKKQEADELKEERLREREEAKAQRELEAQLRKTEEEESRRKEALERARAELRQANEVEREKLLSKIETLQTKLDEATAEHERALSMAQQTRVGYVYVISNLGSFGESVFKIGMTRRVDPGDRVTELGDASVPFTFDVHAMAFTHDAPKLERELHVALGDYRINKINMRKEFFRVPLDVLKEKFKTLAPNANFNDEIDAQEYFLSLAPKEKEAIVAREEAASELPAEI